jgi:SAM-dependent methyltransferase
LPPLHGRQATPSGWLVENADLLPRVLPGAPAPRALDVACGHGRNALWLAAAGYQTEAVDRDEEALADLRRRAAESGLTVAARAVDLERPGVSLGEARYDLIVVFRYLHRPLFPAIRDALRPGGVLVYETFTAAQASRGRPSNPAFLLQAGELQALVAPLRVLRHHEGEVDGAMIAGVVAASATPDDPAGR